MRRRPRLGFAGLGAALVLASAASPALAASAPVLPLTSTSASANALNAILANDIEIGGQVTTTVDTSSMPAALTLDAAGLSIPIVVNGQTQVDVGPYAVGPAFLLAGASAKVWFHFNASGSLVADLVVLTPTVVKGALVSDQNMNSQDPGQGQVLAVQVPAQGGNPAQVVTVDVLPTTTVRIVPPWDASQGLSAATEVAAVGVMAENGTLVAGMVVGVVAQSESS